jgi:signal transduction histidine kinase
MRALLRRRTARLRLTLLYAGLFLLLGTVLIGLTYGLTHSAAAQMAAPSPSDAGPPTGRLVLPEAFSQHAADDRRLLAVSWMMLALSAVAAAALGWFAAGRVLRPLRTITDTARSISAGNLHERLALTGPDDEFKRLGDTLDDLLARLEASFEAQRRFVANASHELRTPLTLDQTLLQVRLADSDSSRESLRATCEELLASSREQEQLLEALLTLASSERGVERREPVDLATAAEQSLERVKQKCRTLDVRAQLDPAPMTGDPALLERMVANLVDNAIDHNVAGGRVAVSTGIEGGHAQLTVTNSGQEITSQEAERLFEPFHRGTTARTGESNGHHGLGLSIVRAIAQAHGATVTAQPQPGGGLTVTFRAPAGISPLRADLGRQDPHRHRPGGTGQIADRFS